MPYKIEPHYAHGTAEKTAVLLINLGTPDAPTAQAVKPYLREFLGDPRVVEIPRAIWWLILNGIILNTRPKKSAAKYASIWLPEGSPLKVHSERQTALLRDSLRGKIGDTELVVDYAMRYGNPSIPAVLARLKAQNCQRILLLPLYPQYAASATATAPATPPAPTTDSTSTTTSGNLLAGMSTLALQPCFVFLLDLLDPALFGSRIGVDRNSSIGLANAAQGKLRAGAPAKMLAPDALCKELPASAEAAGCGRRTARNGT